MALTEEKRCAENTDVIDTEKPYSYYIKQEK